MDKKVGCIKGGRIILENEILRDKAIIFNDKIIDIVDEDKFEQKYSNQEINVIDAQKKYVSPGFIDIHIHGAGGSDTMDAEITALKTISAFVAKGGVTAFLPTTMTMGKEKIHEALDTIRTAMNKSVTGAKILGAHMEGPFISQKHAGVQKRDYI
jgi:N-acetylglucosamine-6-phosphate deacetylase